MESAAAVKALLTSELRTEARCCEKVAEAVEAARCLTKENPESRGFEAVGGLEAAKEEKGDRTLYL